jgi:DNA-binding TFAR19-related protein (PDSD5 family)
MLVVLFFERREKVGRGLVVPSSPLVLENHVMKLSKTVQLGVIILALRLFKNLKIPTPRIISAAALRLGVSSKAGYEAARRIEEALLEIIEGPQSGSKDHSGKDLLRLKLRNQVLAYERDHPSVRLESRKRHLPLSAKALCVRLLREFRRELPEVEIADLLGPALSNIRRWDKIADKDGNFPQKPERRGIHLHASVEDEDRVKQFFEKLKGKLTLEECTKKYNEKYPKAQLDRTTISKILVRLGLREKKIRDSSPAYHDKVKIHFPGAQAAIDAKGCSVRFLGESEETITFKKETAIDLATGTILGSVVGKEETSEGVERVLVKARGECENLLAVLADNRSANCAVDIKKVLGGEGKVGAIFSFPYHPQTNGHIEGNFGKLSRTVGEITIDDSSREAIARSVVEMASRIYDHFHNNTPVKNLGWLTRREYLRRYSPKPQEVEEARRELLGRQARSRALQQDPPRFSDPGYRDLVRSIISDHRFEVELKRALKALQNFDDGAIESASRAFYVASKRKNFDEKKRTFAYFMGIVKNKQKPTDEYYRKRYSSIQAERRFKAAGEAHRKSIKEEQAQEKKDLRDAPEKVILEYSNQFLLGGLRLREQTCAQKIREGLVALKKLGRLKKRVIESLALKIRSWGDFTEKLKESMIDRLFSEYSAVKAT